MINWLYGSAFQKKGNIKLKYICFVCGPFYFLLATRNPPPDMRHFLTKIKKGFRRGYIIWFHSQPIQNIIGSIQAMFLTMIFSIEKWLWNVDPFFNILFWWIKTKPNANLYLNILWNFYCYNEIYCLFRMFLIFNMDFEFDRYWIGDLFVIFGINYI